MAIQRRLVPGACGVLLVLAGLALVALPQDAEDFTRYADELAEIPTADQLRQWHDLLGSEPHVAETPGDQREIDRIADAFEQMGLET